MEYKKFIALFLGVFVSINFYAQYAGQAPLTGGDGGAQGASQALIAYVSGSVMDKKNKELAVDEFQGSPYTSNDFQKTTLFDGNKKVGDFFYRFNAYNSEIEVKSTKNDESVASLSKDKSLAIVEDGKKLRFKTFVDKKGNTMNGYLYELKKGDDYDLYKRINVKFTEGTDSPNSFVKATPHRFSHFEEYYIQEKGVNRIEEVELSNRKILKVIEGPEKERLKAHLKNEDIKVKSEQDLIKVFEFLNS